MGDPMRRPLVRELIARGWHLQATRKGHLRATHPGTSEVVFLPGTPSDWRADRNARAQAARALRDKGTNP